VGRLPLVLVALLLSACALAPRASGPTPAGRDLPALDELHDHAPSGDPLRCTERAAIPAIEHVTVAKWSPDGTRLAFGRILTVPSATTITGYDEEVHLGVLDVYGGTTRELGEGGRPEWSGTGKYLSYLRAGKLHVTRAGIDVAVLEPSLPEVRWLGDELLYWDDARIRTWAPTGGRVLSIVDDDYLPRYPSDDAYFSADGAAFTLTRYHPDGSAERYVGETGSGQLAPLDSPGATYTEWAPAGETLLVRSNERLELRGPDGAFASASVTDFPGPVHGWTPDGKALLMGNVTPTVPGGTAFDRFEAWDFGGVRGIASLPNLLGSRTFSGDGRWFAGVARTSLYGNQLEVYRCGTRAQAASDRADPVARVRQQRIDADPRRFVRPVAGFISQFRQGAHTGIDIAAPIGSLITAADAGTVTFAGWTPVGGRAVCVDHGSAIESCYYHTSVHLVHVGDRVARGQPIATIGMTGLTTGPHVHWEVTKDRMVIDPLSH